MHKGAPKLYFAMKRRQKKPQSSSHQPNKEKNQQHAAIVHKKNIQLHPRIIIIKMCVKM